MDENVCSYVHSSTLPFHEWLTLTLIALGSQYPTNRPSYDCPARVFFGILAN